MKVSRKILQKYIILFCAFITALITICSSNNLFIHVGAFISFCVIPIIIVKIDILHPYCWFTGFFCIYSTAHPILYSLGYNSRIGYSKEIMIYQLVAIFVSLLFITPKKVQYPNFRDKNQMRIDLGIFNKIIYILLILSLVFVAYYVSNQGYTGKSEIYDAGPLWVRIVFRFPLIISIFYTMSIINYYSEHKYLPKKQMSLVGGALLIITLFSGERDFVFRFIIITIMLLWMLKKINLKHLFIIAPIIMTLIPLSHTFKYYFLTHNISNGSENWIQSLLSGEFESASRNLQELVNYSEIVKGSKGFEQIGIDFLSVFSSEISSPTKWFADTFYPNNNVGYGFTLTGEGYIIGGIFGIIILFSIVGLLIRFFYKNSTKNIYSFSAYLYFLTIIIYAIRADFSTILSGIVKQIGLVLLVIFIMERITKVPKINRKNNLECKME